MQNKRPVEGEDLPPLAGKQKASLKVKFGGGQLDKGWPKYWLGRENVLYHIQNEYLLNRFSFVDLKKLVNWLVDHSHRKIDNESIPWD